MIPEGLKFFELLNIEIGEDNIMIANGELDQND